ncbi:hypothetical protein D1227_15660 [Henriciella mobilis]|nr:hypothetical protein D1231_16380 [Henriciella mobilis]RIJ19827.1 hypothetical protein D1227_15660 [Henriciella mobilis]
MINCCFGWKIFHFERIIARLWLQVRELFDQEIHQQPVLKRGFLMARVEHIERLGLSFPFWQNVDQILVGKALRDIQAGQKTDANTLQNSLADSE